MQNTSQIPGLFEPGYGYPYSMGSDAWQKSASCILALKKQEKVFNKISTKSSYLQSSMCYSNLDTYLLTH